MRPPGPQTFVERSRFIRESEGQPWLYADSAISQKVGGSSRVAGIGFLPTECFAGTKVFEDGGRQGGKLAGQP